MLDTARTPAAGVIVVASRAGSETVIRRVMTTSSGRFDLALPVDTLVDVRALRIGHRPTLLGGFRLQRDETRSFETVLAPSPIVLGDVRVVGARSSCRIAPQAGSAAVDLLGEIRKALTLAILTPAAGRPQVEYAVSRGMRDLRGRPLGPMERQVARGISARPFQGRSPDELAKNGYVSEEGDGTTYFAPDADVFLSDAFYETHCLQLTASRAGGRDWIGLAFRPQAAPSVIDIAGTLWVERATNQLRRIEYRYVGFPAGSVLARAPLGGFIDFTVLDDGAWFEDRWEIRMPRVTDSRATATGHLGGMGRGLVVEAIETIGGEVLSLARNGELVYAGPGFASSDSGSGQISEGAVRDTASLGHGSCGLATSTEQVATLFGTVFERPPERSPGARVTVQWREQFQVAASHEWRWSERELAVEASPHGFYAICGVPRARVLQVRARQGSRATSRLATRVAWESARQRLDLRFADPLPIASSRALRVRVVTQDGGAVPFAVVQVNDGIARIADSLGFVALPPAAHDLVRLRARRIGFAQADTAITVSGVRASTDEVRLELKWIGQMMSTVTVTASLADPLVRVGFYDRVMRAQRGAFTAEFVSPEEIGERNAAQVSSLLRGRRAITVSTSKGEPRARTIVLGRGGCAMTVLVDGQRINLELTVAERAVPIDDLVSGRAVSAIEIYPSTANAPSELVPLTGGGACGIVAIWTGAP